MPAAGHSTTDCVCAVAYLAKTVRGDVNRAVELLTARRQAREQAEGGALTRRINVLLREQRPWDEVCARPAIHSCFLMCSCAHSHVSILLRIAHAPIVVGCVESSLHASCGPST